MKVVYGRAVTLVCLMSIFTGVVSGCTIGSKSFSIDSNSRVPFFGLELKERKPKSTAPSYQSISRSNRDLSDVKIAFRVGPAIPAAGQSKRDNRLVATTLSDRQYLYSTPSDGEVRVPNAQKEVPLSTIPLPLTDLERPRADQRVESSDVDFQ